VSLIWGLLVPTALLCWILTPPGAGAMLRLLCLALAMGLGVGLTSCVWFAVHAGGAVSSVTDAVVEIGAVALLALPLRGLRLAPATTRQAVLRGPTRWALPVLLVLVLTWAIAQAAEFASAPHGSWDAIAIWNLHARVLAAGPATWPGFFLPGETCAYHADYPLLLPATVARLWSFSGDTSPYVAAVVGAWLSAATVLLCGATVGVLRGRGPALLAAVTLLGTGFFVRQSATQYADVPLSYFMLAATAALVVAETTAERPARWLGVAGLCAGLAAWTKNEGAQFAIVLIVVATPVALQRGWRAEWRRVAALLAGLLPGLAVLTYFKLTLAPANDLVAGQNAALLLHLLDPTRYAHIVIGLARAIGRVAKVLLVALPLYAAALGATRVAAGRRGARLTAIIYGLMLAGYFGVFLLTPKPLAWHLNTAAARLMLQLFPGALLAVFLAVAAPEEASAAAG